MLWAFWFKRNLAQFYKIHHIRRKSHLDLSLEMLLRSAFSRPTKKSYEIRNNTGKEFCSQISERIIQIWYRTLYPFPSRGFSQLITKSWGSFLHGSMSPSFWVYDFRGPAGSGAVNACLAMVSWPRGRRLAMKPQWQLMAWSAGLSASMFPPTNTVLMVFILMSLFLFVYEYVIVTTDRGHTSAQTTYHCGIFSS